MFSVLTVKPSNTSVPNELKPVGSVTVPLQAAFSAGVPM